MTISLAHVINPVIVPQSSDLYIAQPITFETMRIAQERAGSDVSVELWAAFYPEDEGIVPGHFRKTAPLDRSVLDLGVTGGTKKLPLVKDVIDRLYQRSTADYFIYTNTDIALTPDFYLAVRDIIGKGYDGFAINRRTISMTYADLQDIHLMVEEALQGEKHPGYDCFVFRRESYSRFVLGNVCIGANWIGRAMLGNVMAFSTNFNVFEDLHLTFHRGDERPWQGNEHNSYNRHNEQELVKILEALLESDNINQRDWLEQWYEFHRRRLSSARSHSPGLDKTRRYMEGLPPCVDQIIPWEAGKVISGLSAQVRQDPIFIVGFPRSGTTLLQALLATQRNVSSFPETHFFSIAENLFGNTGGVVTTSGVEQALERIRQRLDVSPAAEEHSKKLAAIKALGVKSFFEIIVADQLAARVGPGKVADVRWIEKTPDHVFSLGRIFSLYPQAKVICVMRDPGKAIISRRRHFKFSREEEWPIQRHAVLWLRTAQMIMRWQKKQPLSVLIVRLEDIISDLVGVVGSLCGFAGIAFDKDLLAAYKGNAASIIRATESWKEGVREDLSRSVALGRGNSLSYTDSILLHTMAGKELRQYGYHSLAQGGPLPEPASTGSDGGDLPKKVLIFFPQNPYPPKTGAHRRCLSVLKVFLRMGYDVTLFSHNLSGGFRWTDQDVQVMRDTYGINVVVYSETQDDIMFMEGARRLLTDVTNWQMYTPPGMASAFRQIFRNLSPDVTFISYAYWGGLLNGDDFYSSLNIIDTLDLVTASTKMWRKLQTCLKEPPYDASAADPELLKEDFYSAEDRAAAPEEFMIYDRFDHAIAISEMEAKSIREHTLWTNVITAPITYDVVASEGSYARGPIFVMGDNPFNIQGYLFFAAKVLPEVRRQVPDFELTVVGEVTSRLVAVDGVRLAGYVPDLRGLYAEASFAICPVTGGTGMPVKIIEAMAHGLPVIAMRSGGQSSPIVHGGNGYIAENNEEFARYAVSLSLDRARCRHMGAAARKSIAEGYSEDVLYERLSSILAKRERPKDFYLRDLRVRVNNMETYISEMQEYVVNQENELREVRTILEGMIHEKDRYIKSLLEDRYIARYVGALEARGKRYLVRALAFIKSLLKGKGESGDN
ncbi:MAG: sulfotransferase [Thermodesulfovibrionales bacterium]